MLRVSVKADITRALRRIGATHAEARKAIPRALNKTATTARARAAREIVAAGYGIKIAPIKRAITIKRATVNSLTAEVRATGRVIGLIQYGARQTSAGVSVAVLHGRHLLKGTFIATMPNGHKGVFVRVGSAAHKALATKLGIKEGHSRSSTKHGLPIKELFGPSVPAAFANEQVQQALTAAIRDRFPTVLRQELRFVGLID